MKSIKSLILITGLASFLVACDSSNGVIELNELPTAVGANSLPPVKKRMVSVDVTFPSGGTSGDRFDYWASGLLKEHTTFRDGVIDVIYQFELDDIGRVLRISTDNGSDNDGGPDGIEDLSETWTYLEDFGQHKAYVRNSAGQVTFVVVYDFEDGLAVNKTNIDIIDVDTIAAVNEATGTVTGRTAYFYQQGRVASANIFGSAGELRSTISYVYNDDGTMQSSTLVDPQGTELNSAVYGYVEGECTRETFNSVRDNRCVTISE